MQIRNFVSGPILFLDEQRIEEGDKIRGFGSRRRDYIVKPFSVEELGARVSAHLRAGNAVKRVSAENPF